MKKGEYQTGFQKSAGSPEPMKGRHSTRSKPPSSVLCIVRNKLPFKAVCSLKMLKYTKSTRVKDNLKKAPSDEFSRLITKVYPMNNMCSQRKQQNKLNNHFNRRILDLRKGSSLNEDPLFTH